MDTPASSFRPSAVSDLVTARPLTRRTVLAAAVAGAGVVLAAPGALAAPHRAVPAPETVPLPVGFRPEGITSGPGTRFYVGSVASGRILTGDLLTGVEGELLPALAGRSLRGLRWDARTGLVWAVGSVGADSFVWAVDAGTGGIASITPVPGARFLNDVDLTANAAWVTDSNVDRLTRIAAPGGVPTGAAATSLDLTGAWPVVSGFSATGVRALPDGSLVLNNTTAGGLWRVPLPSGAVEPIPVTGGPGIVSGDGLELDGSVLYNVRGAAPDSVAVVVLEHDGGWSARWAGNRADETLSVPSTATVAGGWLWAVNARFNVVPDANTADYWITRLPAK